MGKDADRTHPRWKKTGLLPGNRYSELYELSKAGIPEKDIAYKMGISPATLIRLKERDPAVKDLLKAGKRRSSGSESFQEYLYGHLTYNQRKFWDQITGFWKQDKKTAAEKVRTLLEGSTTGLRMGLWAHAMICNQFNATKACRATGVSYTTLKHWYKSPKFKKLWEEIEWHKDNFFEGGLTSLVKKGVPAAVLHAAKSRLATRGYASTVKFEGAMTHTNEDKVSIEDLNIPIETRKQLLRALRDRKRKDQKALTAHEDVQDAEVVSIKRNKK
jgi:hypothetical protein